MFFYCAWYACRERSDKADAVGSSRRRGRYRLRRYGACSFNTQGTGPRRAFRKRIDLIDPDTKQVTAIGGFSRRASFGGGHRQGVTSADEGRGLLFATDRDAKLLNVVDPKIQSVIATAILALGPDYVRYVSTTGEVWVTQPRAARIEVFSLPPAGAPKPAHVTFIPIPGSPQSLIIDNTRGRAYTHLHTDTTLAIDLKSHRDFCRAGRTAVAAQAASRWMMRGDFFSWGAMKGN